MKAGGKAVNFKTFRSLFFQTGKFKGKYFDWTNLEKHKDNRNLMIKGIGNGKGLVFWPDEATRNDVTHDHRHKDGLNYNRRFVYNTCASLFLSN
jgi:hypothetical protein